jgi:hypothetical protein
LLPFYYSFNAARVVAMKVTPCGRQLQTHYLTA